MADVTKSVEIIFSTTFVDGGAEIREAGDSIQAFTDKTLNLISPLNALADTVKLTDAAIVGLGIAFGGAALSAAGQFNQAVTENGTLFNATTEQLAALKNQTLEYAAGSTQSIESINSAVYKAISSGIEWKNAITFVADAERLAVAGRADLTQVTLALTGAMNAYGAQVSETTAYSDVFMKTVQTGQTTLPELANSLGQVVSIAAAAKIPFADLMAAIAAITSTGVPTSEAMTSIKAAITNIINPSKEATEAAEALKIKFNATSLASQGFAGTMKEVYAATGGSIEKITSLFGSVEALKAVTILGADANGGYAKTLESIGTATGSTQAAFVSLENSWENLNANLKNNLDIMMIHVGDQLGPEFSNIIEGLKGVLQSVTFSINAGAFDEVFVALSGVESKIAEFLKQLAANLPAALEQVNFGKLATSITTLAESLGGIFDGIDISTPEGLARAIQLVVDTIANLLNQGSGIAQVWGDMLDGVLPLVQAFSEMSDEAAIASGKVLGFADVLTAVLPALGSIGKGLEAIGTGLELVGGVQLTKFVAGLGTAAAASNVTAAAALSLGAALGSGGMVAAAGGAGYAIGTVFGGALDWVIGKLTGGSSLGGAIYDLTHQTEDLSGAASKATEPLREVSGKITEYGTAAASATAGVDALTTKTNDLGQPVNSLGQTLDQIVTKTGDWADKAVAAATKTTFLKEASEALADATKKVHEATVITTEGQGVYANAVSKTFDEMARAAAAYIESARAAGTEAEAKKEVVAEFEKYYAAVEKSTTSTNSFKDSMASAATAAGTSAKDLLAVAKAAGEIEVKLEQIASNERIKNIEAKMKLDISNVEANAKIATAILDNVSQTYQADTSLIGDLMSQVTDGYSMADKLRMQMAEDANRRVGELHEAQMKIIAAQIDYLSAKAAAVAQGDPIVSINADGLEPALEAFMWQILKKIQVKMSLDGASAILGSPTAAW